MKTNNREKFHLLNKGLSSKNKKSRITSESPGLQFYMDQTDKYPILSREEEVSLAKQYRDTKDKKAFDKLVNSNLKFVMKVANKFRGYSLPFEEIVQEGNIGLIRAVEKFDPDKGHRLISYAVYWIKAYIRNYVYSNHSLVKMSGTHRQRKMFFGLRTEKSRLESKFERELSSRELAEELELDVREVETVLNRIISGDYSLQTPTTGHEDKGIENQRDAQHFLIDNNPLPDEATFSSIFKKDIRDIVEDLYPSFNDRERLILEKRLLSHDPLTLQQIGQHFGVSRERTRQIETKLCKTLATKLYAFSKESVAVETGQ